MEIKSDIILKGNIWFELQQGYVKKYFDTLWGVFLTCVSIGILYDKQMDDEDDEDDRVTIPRSMFNRNAKEMEFFFQSAILTSKTVNFGEKDRLYLAFSETFSVEELDDLEKEALEKGVSKEAREFDKISFLRKFANFGATKLHKCLSKSDIETLEKLNSFFVDSYNGETDELLEMSLVDDLPDFVDD